MSVVLNILQRLKSRLASPRKIALAVLAVFAFVPLTILFTNTTAVTQSVNGATIPTLTQVTDNYSNTWAVTGGVVQENGKAAGYTSGVVKLVFLNNTIYQENTASNWWYWSGTAWVAASADPRTPSASGASVPTSSVIIDSSKNIWTISGGVIYENGVAAPNTSNVIKLSYINAKVYQENSALHWWYWNGTAWASTWPVPPVSIVAEGGTFDLNTTLPNTTTAGGTFAVDTSGSALPSQIALSACGIISNTSTTALNVDGVVFSYDSAVPCK